MALVTASYRESSDIIAGIAGAPRRAAVYDVVEPDGGREWRRMNAPRGPRSIVVEIAVDVSAWMWRRDPPPEFERALALVRADLVVMVRFTVPSSILDPATAGAAAAARAVLENRALRTLAHAAIDFKPPVVLTPGTTLTRQFAYRDTAGNEFAPSATVAIEAVDAGLVALLRSTWLPAPTPDRAAAREAALVRARGAVKVCELLAADAERMFAAPAERVRRVIADDLDKAQTMLERVVTRIQTWREARLEAESLPRPLTPVDLNTALIARGRRAPYLLTAYVYGGAAGAAGPAGAQAAHTTATGALRKATFDLYAVAGRVPPPTNAEVDAAVAPLRAAEAAYRDALAALMWSEMTSALSDVEIAPMDVTGILPWYAKIATEVAAVVAAPGPAPAAGTPAAARIDDLASAIAEVDVLVEDVVLVVEGGPLVPAAARLLTRAAVAVSALNSAYHATGVRPAPGQGLLSFNYQYPEREATLEAAAVLEIGRAALDRFAQAMRRGLGLVAGVVALGDLSVLADPPGRTVAQDPWHRHQAALREMKIVPATVCADLPTLDEVYAMRADQAAPAAGLAAAGTAAVAAAATAAATFDPPPVLPVAAGAGGTFVAAAVRGLQSDVEESAGVPPLPDEPDDDAASTTSSMRADVAAAAAALEAQDRDDAKSTTSSDADVQAALDLLREYERDEEAGPDTSSDVEDAVDRMLRQYAETT